MLAVRAIRERFPITRRTLRVEASGWVSIRQFLVRRVYEEGVMNLVLWILEVVLALTVFHLVRGEWSSAATTLWCCSRWRRSSRTCGIASCPSACGEPPRKRSAGRRPRHL
jgi:hypothetical protein